ncbi:hypothetical protein N9O57_00990 [bacterium]|nr:hypothetical protein [bacterium]
MYSNSKVHSQLQDYDHSFNEFRLRQMSRKNIKEIRKKQLFDELQATEKELQFVEIKVHRDVDNSYESRKSYLAELNKYFDKINLQAGELDFNASREELINDLDDLIDDLKILQLDLEHVMDFKAS